MTFREVFAAIRGAAKARNRVRQLALWSAWHVEAFARTKRLPDIGELLRKLDGPRTMSPKAMRNAIIGIAEAMGARVTTKKRG